MFSRSFDSSFRVKYAVGISYSIVDNARLDIDTCLGPLASIRKKTDYNVIAITACSKVLVVHIVIMYISLYCSRLTVLSCLSLGVHIIGLICWCL